MSRQTLIPIIFRKFCSDVSSKIQLRFLQGVRKRIELENNARPENRGTNYAGLEKCNAGIVHPMITRRSMQWIQLVDPVFSLGWIMLRRMPWLLNLAKRLKVKN